MTKEQQEILRGYMDQSGQDYEVVYVHYDRDAQHPEMSVHYQARESGNRIEYRDAFDGEGRTVYTKRVELNG